MYDDCPIYSSKKGSMMARKRELRYFLYPANAIGALIVYACIASLGLLAFGSYPSSPAYIGAKIVAAVILIGFGLATLHALVALVALVFR